MSIDQFLLSGSDTDLNYPNVRPTLDLNFARTKTLDPRITFTRASGGTYVGADGLIKYAGVNEPRFDHDPETGESLGLLIEESRVNIHKNNHSGLSGSGLSNGDRFHWDTNSTDEIAPDGSNSTFKVYGDGTETNPGGSMYLIADGSGNNTTYTTTNVHTSSVFIKPALNKRFRFDAHSQFASDTDGGDPANISFFFDLSTPQGEVTSIETPGGISASVTPYPNGWYRCTWTYYRNSTNPVSSNYGVIIYSEDYYNVAQGIGTYFYVWGPQVEQGSFPTSYIPTQGSTRTRALDNASITGKNFSEWYRQDEGSIFSNYITRVPTNANQNNVDFVIENETSTNRIIGWNNFQKNPVFSLTENNVANYVFYGFISKINTPVKRIIGIKDFDVKIYVGTDALIGDFASSIPDKTPRNLTRMFIGVGNGFSALNGTISRLTYYPKRLPNSQLQALTR